MSCGLQTVKDLGCLYVGATKHFTGQLRNSNTGQGLSLVGKELSMAFAHRGHVTVVVKSTFGDTPEAKAGVWELEMSTEQSSTLRPATEYDVEFQLSDLRMVPTARVIVGVAVINTLRRIHND